MANMRIFFIGFVQETEERSALRVNQLKSMVKGMQEEMNRFMSDMHGLVSALDLIDHPATASSMEGISTATQGVER